MWSHLNHYDLPDDDLAYSDARRRILGRLGDYAALIVAPMNLRPTAAALLSEDAQRIEVRVSTPGKHIILVIAPDGDLAAEVFFLRALADKHLPLPQLIASDLACTLVPFTYSIEGFIGGQPLDRLEDGPLVRVAARQIGRTLRRIHQTAAPGFGRPVVSGRWPSQGWPAVLESWLAQREMLERAQELLGSDLLAALRAATLDHPALNCQHPRVIHSEVEPGRALVAVGESIQLTALVRPGEIVAGDPLFDLAQATLPRHPPAFRQGLLEGYRAAGPLSPEQEDQLRRYELLLHVADTLWRGDAEMLAQLPGETANTLSQL